MSYTTKEMRERLKAQVKATVAEGVRLRLLRKACGAAGDPRGASAARVEQVDHYRPRARGLFLAYAFLKGRTYHEVEARHGDENEPYGYLGYLQEWEGDPDLAIDWVAAGDKTRFELTPAVEEEPVKASERSEPPPAPTGLLGRLRATVGVGVGA